MKFYVAFDNESFKEAIESHRNGGYSSEQEAVEDTSKVLDRGDEFLVITDHLATLSRYRMTEVDKKVIAVRITEPSTKDMRRSHLEMTHEEVLYELYQALLNQQGNVSIMVRNKMELARKKLGK